MIGRTRSRFLAAAAATAALALSAVLSGCATIPDTGDVHEGGSEVVTGGDIGQIASGPTKDAQPDEVVRGFLLAAQAGPTSTTAFSVAREYLTTQAAQAWVPYSRVLVMDDQPQPLLDAGADLDSGRVTVQASGTVVASIDDRGVFTEEPTGSAQDATFELVQVGGQWRIDHLDDGLMVPSAVFGPAFGSVFHATTLYFPTPDLTSWVPDVRWFPQTTWRTYAVQALLAGPPDYLAGAATTVLPAGTGLVMNSVTEGADGSFEVELTDQIVEASGEARGLFAEQVRVTLAGGQGDVAVTLIDRNGPIVPPQVDTPSLPRTPSTAVAVRAGELWDVAGRTLELSPLPVHLSGLDPTAIALGYDGSTVVVRDGEDRLVRVTGDEPTELLAGPGLLAPSIDRDGTVWSGEPGGPLTVVTSTGDRHSLAVPWLEGRTVTSVRVSPEGARVAVVSTGVSGTAVQVAGVVRDERGVPTSLASPITVGASVDLVEQAVWQDEAVLALLGRDDSGAAAVFLAGVGGLGGSVGGVPRRVVGITDPAWLSAAVGSGGILALDGANVLYLRQTTAVWPEVGQGVQAAAFPG
jgi:hypothetical protein